MQMREEGREDVSDASLSRDYLKPPSGDPHSKRVKARLDVIMMMCVKKLVISFTAGL